MGTNEPASLASTWDDIAAAEKRDGIRPQKRMERAAFASALGIELIRAARYGRPLSLALLRLRPALGAHISIWQSQRRVLLTELHNRSTDILRVPDFAARVQENDFAICLPETVIAGAERAVEKFLASDRIVAVSDLSGQGGVRLRWRIVEREKDELSAEALLDRAGKSFAIREDADTAEG